MMAINKNPFKARFLEIYSQKVFISKFKGRAGGQGAGGSHYSGAAAAFAAASDRPGGARAALQGVLARIGGTGSGPSPAKPSSSSDLEALYSGLNVSGPGAAGEGLQLATTRAGLGDRWYGASAHLIRMDHGRRDPVSGQQASEGRVSVGLTAGPEIFEPYAEPMSPKLAAVLCSFETLSSSVCA